jgi:hypothetical protein
MTSFHFRLEMVLSWRRTKLEVEEIKFKQAAADVAGKDRALSELREAAGKEESQLRSGKSTIGLDWAALGFYRLDVKNDERELERQRAESLKKLAVQQTAMLEARQCCRLMERLKERRLAEWEVANNRELDEMAAEAYLAQWSQRQRETL